MLPGSSYTALALVGVFFFAVPRSLADIRVAKLAELPEAIAAARPGATSPVLGSAAVLPEPLATDLDGQPRKAPADVGADQRSEAPVTRRPLTAMDVGPHWLRR